MTTRNDYEGFALQVIQVILDSGSYKPTEALITKVGKMMEYGPLITVWPRDLAEASQRARDAANSRARAPVPLTMPTLPRLVPLVPPPLPAVAPLPRLAPLPQPPLTLPPMVLK